MTYEKIQKILSTMGLKLKKSEFGGYLIIRLSDGGEFGNFGSLDEVENFLYDYHGE